MNCFQKTAVSALAIAAMQSSAQAGNDYYEISITNLTKGQIFSPLFVAAHGRGVSLFEVGTAASAELAGVAQDASYGPLVDVFTATPRVNHVSVGGELIFPGQTVNMKVPADDDEMLSIASMLVTTNDAFTGVSALRVKGKKSMTLMLPAYDAGSEANSESCEHIPGPPCGMAHMAPAEAPEGYVYIHGGIHGHGDLIPGQHDWNNPVAKLKIKYMGD